MDHKVSKDMISSGMIPSGEKTQADLGRTQYGSAPSPNTLLDAYKSIYEHHQKDADGNVIPHEDEDVKEGVGTVVGGAYGAKKGGLKGAIVGGTAGAMLDSLNKPKKKNGVKTEEAEPVNEILGMAAGAIGAKLAGGAAAKAALAKGATAGAAKMAAMKAGTGAAIKYGTAGSVAGSVGKAGAGALAGGAERKRTISADADLFDIVKGKLLDEGLTEEECLDVMLTLTLEEINEVVKLDEVTAGLLMKAAKAAEVARGKAAVMGNKALAMKKLGQGEKFYKGAVAKRKAAGQMGAGYKEGM